MKTIILAAIAALLLTVTAIWAFESEEHELYVMQCIQAVAEIETFSCGDGAVVPVTVNGQIITSDTFQPDMDCDRPALLSNGHGSDGQCVPGSRILNLSTETAQISAMCRQKNNRPTGSLLFDEIDVIAHNPSTGATCWFQAKADSPDAPLDGETVISPTDLDGPEIWADPESLVKDGCGNCHDNDAFMYSPFVGQVWDEVPANPLGPYFHVGAEFGFDQWPTQTFDMRDNTCVGCHRIGRMETCNMLTEYMVGGETPDGADRFAQEFPQSHAMPPNHGLTRAAWSTFHSRSVAQIRSCCDNPDQQICELTELPKYE
jgi:hypothetical protein